MVKELKIQHKTVLIDDEATILLNNYDWKLQKSKTKWKEKYYAVTTNQTYMHRLIIGAKKGEIVDHINGNTLDNRLDNLRITSQRINAINRHHPRTSEYPGVHWNKQKNRWGALIKIKDKLRFLGYFTKEEDAGNAYLWALSQVEKGKQIPFLSSEKTSKYPNVYFNNKMKKWCGEFIKNKKKYYVGSFDNEYDAHKAVLKRKEEVG